MENAENTLSCRGKINEKRSAIHRVVHICHSLYVFRRCRGKINEERSATLLFLIGKFFYYLGFNEKKSATKNQQ